MSTERLRRSALLFQASYVREMGRSNQSKYGNLKPQTASCMCTVRLPGWGPPIPSESWLKTLGDIDQRCSQWHSCIRKTPFSIFSSNIICSLTFLFPSQIDGAETRQQKQNHPGERVMGGKTELKVGF